MYEEFDIVLWHSGEQIGWDNKTGGTFLAQLIK